MKKLFISLRPREGSVSISREEINQFEKESVFVCSFYESLIENRFIKINRITIELVQNNSKTLISKPISNVLKIRRFYDFSEYLQKSEESDRLKLILDILNESLVEVARKQAVDQSFLLTVKNTLLEKDFCQTNQLHSEVMSNDELKSIYLTATHRIGKVDIEAIVKNKKDNTEISYMIFQMFPYSESEIISLFKSVGWIDNYRAVIGNDTNEIFFELDLLGNINIRLEPKEHTEEFLTEELKMLSYSTTIQEVDDILTKNLENEGK